MLSTSKNHYHVTSRDADSHLLVLVIDYIGLMYRTILPRTREVRYIREVERQVLPRVHKGISMSIKGGPDKLSLKVLMGKVIMLCHVLGLLLSDLCQNIVIRQRFLPSLAPVYVSAVKDSRSSYVSVRNNTTRCVGVQGYK